MAIRISVFNLKTKQKSVRHIYDDNQYTLILMAQGELYREVKWEAFNIVLTEYIEQK